MEASQIPMNFTFRSADGREDFLVAQANEIAVGWIDKWPAWQSGFLILTGPRGCGKSHLAGVWQTMSNAILIQSSDLAGLSIEALAEIATTPVLCEDIKPGVAETEMFHLFNLMVENKNSMLITAEMAPKQWNLTLPDLASRLGTIPIAAIEEPDDQLFAALVVKHFSDRQLAVTPDVVQYLLNRIERSFAEIARMVSILDKRALAQKRKINIPLVRDVLMEEQEN
ncbi:DnaA/Hda family protein [Sneathiella marina]|uniref:DnaA/Hda family protein n=1 Tax=Sneathiella marina TaxID=2950108 RepID=A0ABY4W123_9PROT|nr:DnaA/Hda family protein [Sneathiella marina]USG59470.1 DnaA/Hda family protein [Sneathiella marina]